MTGNEKHEMRAQLLSTVRDFVNRDVIPQAAKHDEDDTYPSDLVNQMAEMGLFGLTVPEKYGGFGMDQTTYAMVFEELAKGWLSITGPIGTHSVLTSAIAKYGSDEQKVYRELSRLVADEIAESERAHRVLPTKRALVTVPAAV